MPIDVQDPGLNPILNGCFWALALVALASLAPWLLRGGRNRWTLWLPLAAAALQAVYEVTMPSRWDIRLDLVLIAPLLAVVVAGWIVRLVLLRAWRKQSLSK